MPWFRRSTRLDSKTINTWIGSVRSQSERRTFHEMRKNVQAGMLNEIATHFLSTFTDKDGEAAYLAIHVLSGRTKIKPVLLEVNPKASRKAEELFRAATSSPPPTEQFAITCVYNCSLEITNETLEEHYADALILADHGLTHWPGFAELWRQRGVLRLATSDIPGAIEDLRKAKAMKADLLWIDEPLAYADQLNRDR
jgi:hypothetical protein